MVIAYLLIINAAGFVLMHTDKRRAIKNQWRIAEKYLFGTAVLGGSPGVILGMYTARHKTRHPSFTVGIPVILTLQIILAVIFFSISKSAG